MEKGQVKIIDESAIDTAYLLSMIDDLEERVSELLQIVDKKDNQIRSILQGRSSG